MTHTSCFALPEVRTPQRRSALRLGAILLLLCLIARPQAAIGQNTTCIPLGTGVPPNSRPPNWWNSAAPEYRLRLDDRTWLGAVSHSDGSANSGHVDFRAIHRQDSLFLSWIVKVDPQLDPNPSGLLNQDVLWFGIEQVAGKKPVVFRLSLSTAEDGLEASPKYAIWAWEVDAADPAQPMQLTTLVFRSGHPTLPPPNWFTQAARLWTGSSSGEDWAFQLIIPTNGTNPFTNGLSVSTGFRMWYQTSIRLSASTAPVPYTWPRGLTSIQPDGVGGPNLSQWGTFTKAAAPPEPTCLGNLTIASHGEIGTTNLSPVEIHFSKPAKPLAGNPAALAPKNTFYVRPTNRTAATIPNGEITARFWVANWGSQPDWEDVPNPADLWKEVPQPPTAPSNSLPPGPATQANQIALQWNMTPCQWFNFLSPAEYSDTELLQWLNNNGLNCPNSAGVLTERYLAKEHQCVLAELVSPPGTPPRTFLRKSYWNNLDVVQASTFSRDAAISVQGLHPREGSGPKTVYLYVQTFNMSPRVSAKGAPPQDTKVTDSIVRRTRQRDSLSAAFDPVFGERRVDLTMPTYWVHVYRETADSIATGGSKQPILRPQNSFGYRVEHEGDLEGWRHSIRGAEGAHLEQLAPNFYRLSVPNDSFAVVTTTIEALELPRFALSLHAGASLPHGSFNTTHNPGFGITADAEYWWNRKFAVAALLGYHRFGGAGANPDLDLFHASGAIEARVTTGSPSVLVDAGGGFYNFSPGGSDPGVHAGVGVEFDVSPTVALGATGRVHSVFTTGSNTTFSSLQVGGRIKF